LSCFDENIGTSALLLPKAFIFAPDSSDRSQRVNTPWKSKRINSYAAFSVQFGIIIKSELLTHIKVYRGRDNFGNILLQVFSILGLVTIITGFLLFFKTYKYRKH
jgi:hypothetical protein